MLQKPSEFVKTTAASEETVAKKLIESALKLQSPSTINASDVSRTQLFMLVTDVEDAALLEDAALAASVEDAE